MLILLIILILSAVVTCIILIKVSSDARNRLKRAESLLGIVDYCLLLVCFYLSFLFFDANDLKHHGIGGTFFPWIFSALIAALSISLVADFWSKEPNVLRRLAPSGVIAAFIVTLLGSFVVLREYKWNRYLMCQARQVKQGLEYYREVKGAYPSSIVDLYQITEEFQKESPQQDLQFESQHIWPKDEPVFFPYSRSCSKFFPGKHMHLGWVSISLIKFMRYTATPEGYRIGYVRPFRFGDLYLSCDYSFDSSYWGCSILPKEKVESRNYFGKDFTLGEFYES